MSFTKKSLILISALFLAGSITAETSISSFAGAAADISLQKNKTVAIEARGVYAGQYTIDNKIIVRGDFIINTENILDGGLFQDTSAKFSINEASLSYRFFGNNTLHQISGFVGRQESLGSDLFVKRFLGIRNLSSDFLTPQLNYAMPGIYTYEGVGLSYTTKFPASQALAFYSSYDRNLLIPATTDSPAVYDSKITADFRYASVWDWGVMDCGMGIEFPIENEDTAGVAVILMMRKVNLRAGAATLIELNRSTSLFLQAGLSGLQIAPPEGAFNIHEITPYLFIEPRYKTEFTTSSLSVFWVDKDTLKNCMYAKFPIGIDLMMKSNGLLFFGHTTNAGIHMSATTDTIGTTITNFNIQLTPFIEYSLLNGKMSAYTKIQPVLFKDPGEIINVTIGYKSLF